jgi:hypothetical protein
MPAMQEAPTLVGVECRISGFAGSRQASLTTPACLTGGDIVDEAFETDHMHINLYG